jgi:hypothetical protein
MFYKFTCNDSSSDHGYWVVIIEAVNKRKAVSMLENHLFENGKLTDDYKCERVVGPIIHSTVESNHV